MRRQTVALVFEKTHIFRLLLQCSQLLLRHLRLLRSAQGTGHEMQSPLGKGGAATSLLFLGCDLSPFHCSLAIRARDAPHIALAKRAAGALLAPSEYAFEAEQVVAAIDLSQLRWKKGSGAGQCMGIGGKYLVCLAPLQQAGLEAYGAMPIEPLPLRAGVFICSLVGIHG